METATIIIIAALALSEALSLIPAVKANGIFQAIYNLLRRMSPSSKSTNKPKK